MYNRMRAGNETQLSFEKVRVFSISRTSKHLLLEYIVRGQQENNKLEFPFDELYVLEKYNRDQACLLIRNMPLDHRLIRLRDCLIQTFRTILGRTISKTTEIEHI